MRWIGKLELVATGQLCVYSIVFLCLLGVKQPNGLCLSGAYKYAPFSALLSTFVNWETEE